MIAVLAESWGWDPQTTMRQQAAFAFHCAMRASRCRWERLDDSVTAATFLHEEKRSRKSLANRIAFMLSGPGRLVEWKATLKPEIKAKVEECERELDETIAMLRAAGIELEPPTREANISHLFKKSKG